MQNGCFTDELMCKNCQLIEILEKNVTFIKNESIDLDLSIDEIGQKYLAFTNESLQNCCIFFLSDETFQFFIINYFYSVKRNIRNNLQVVQVNY